MQFEFSPVGKIEEEQPTPTVHRERHQMLVIWRKNI